MSRLAWRLAHAPKGRGHSCSIGILLATWPVEANKEDFDALKAALVDPEWAASDIVRAMEAEGYTVSLRHVRAHRRGECTSATCPLPNDARLTP